MLKGLMLRVEKWFGSSGISVQACGYMEVDGS